MIRWSRLLAASLAVAVAVALPAASGASVPHSTVVEKQPVNYTPRLVPDTAVERPRAVGIAELGGTMYAGGLFRKVYDEVANKELVRNNFVIFKANTGAVSAAAPSFNGEVWAVEADQDSVFVGGSFSAVDGIERPRLVKLHADGSVDTSFNARLRGGRVVDLHMYEGPAGPMLVVGGSAGKLLMALDPDTGADTGFIDLGISDKIPDSFGGVTVHNFSISPDGSKLVAVGNFMTVDGESRKRAFMADLPTLKTKSATLSPWYYKPFEKNCNVTTARRLAYLTDVDFSPDGDYFVVVATGHISARGDLHETVCDAAARFETPGPLGGGSNDPFRPTWINYTGGDTIWSVAVTGAAVYVQGHFQYLDNAGGVGDNTAPTAVSRKGIGAIDPDDGLALPWNPAKPAKQGGKQLLATTAGLWTVSDSKRFAGEPRYGIAFNPVR